MKVFLISLIIAVNIGFANNISVNFGIPSASKGLIGINLHPNNSSFEYSIFYGDIDLVNFDAGLGLSYYLNENSGFYLSQGYHWLFGGNSLTPHTLGILTGLGYNYEMTNSFSVYSDLAVPVFLNENGTYLYFTGTEYDSEHWSVSIGLGLSYSF